MPRLNSTEGEMNELSFYEGYLEGKRRQEEIVSKAVQQEASHIWHSAELVEVDLDKVPFHRAIKLIKKKHPPDHADSIIARMQNGASYDDAVYSVKKYGSGRKNRK
jgi:hypothetical protein